MLGTVSANGASSMLCDAFNAVAKEYDENRRKFIPCFDAFYYGATEFIASSISYPRHILDLGAGTGLLTKCWMKYFPDAAYTLIDVASGMLDIARKRFSGCGNISYHVADYATSFSTRSMLASYTPAFDVIISALSIHHLNDEDKAHLFEHIWKVLPSGGVFANYDQFCADSVIVDAWINKYWENKILHSGLEQKDIARWRERQVLDRECTISAQLSMLRREGTLFNTAECIYRDGKFAVIVAVKR